MPPLRVVLSAVSCYVVLQIQPLDPGEVLLLEGQPVTAGAPVLLVHCATLAPLAIDAGMHTSDPQAVTHRPNWHHYYAAWMGRGIIECHCAGSVATSAASTARRAVH